MSAMLTYVSSLPGKLSDLDIQNRISNSGPWTKACLAAASVYGTYQGLHIIYTYYRKHVNDKKRDKKRLENQRSIQDLGQRVQQNPLNEGEVQRITHLSVPDLIDELKTSKVRPIDALRAYQTQALRAHEKTNCLVEAIEEAENRALELEKGPREGLLWGVPISIKDDVGIKGYDNCLGMVESIGNPAGNDGAILKVLLHHGAIPFVKTNVPQTEMSFEPGNPIHGVVRNPHALHRGPGGSSSGEAALIASYGSPLGVGSDLAGSIRVPAHFCGIQGFKPTPDRMSWKDNGFDGSASMTPFQEVWGPLSRDVDGLVLQMRALWEDCLLSKEDDAVPWQPFDDKEYNSDRKLRIGFYTENPIFPTFAACKRAVNETVGLLSKEGHELVPWQPPKFEETMELCIKIFSLDGGALFHDLKYDRIDPTIEALAQGHVIPDGIRWILDLIVRPLSPATAEKFLLRVGPANAVRYMEVAYELVKFRRLIYDAGKEANLDAIICPANVMVAPPLGSAKLLFYTCIYTLLYNLLHYPAGVVHSTNVTQTDLSKLNEDYSDTSDKLIKEAKAAMTSTEGLPVGVMVAAPRYRDETCLRVLKIIEDCQSK